MFFLENLYPFSVFYFVLLMYLDLLTFRVDMIDIVPNHFTILEGLEDLEALKPPLDAQNQYLGYQKRCFSISYYFKVVPANMWVTCTKKRCNFLYNQLIIVRTTNSIILASVLLTSHILALILRRVPRTRRSCSGSVPYIEIQFILNRLHQSLNSCKLSND